MKTVTFKNNWGATEYSIGAEKITGLNTKSKTLSVLVSYRGKENWLRFREAKKIVNVPDHGQNFVNSFTDIEVEVISTTGFKVWVSLSQLPKVKVLESKFKFEG